MSLPRTAGTSLSLAYHPPLDWAAMAAWLARRAIAGVEAVQGGEYVRSLSLPHGGEVLHGWIRVREDAPHAALAVDVAPALRPVLPQVQARVRRVFDLDASPRQICAALGELAAPRPGLRLPGAASGFEGAARAVLEQQVSTAAAACLLMRLAERFGEAAQTPWPAVQRRFPTAAAIAGADVGHIAAIGIPRQRARALQQLAREVAEGRLDLEGVADIDAGLAQLRGIPGIGPWTAGYIAIRAWSWPDVFLATDYVVRKRLPGLTPRAVEAHARRWSPWRSYAVFHLWASDAAVAVPVPPGTGS